jgi:hypothetical protein
MKTKNWKSLGIAAVVLLSFAAVASTVSAACSWWYCSYTNKWAYGPSSGSVYVEEWQYGQVANGGSNAYQPWGSNDAYAVSSGLQNYRRDDTDTVTPTCAPEYGWFEWETKTHEERWENQYRLMEYYVCEGD